MDFTCIWCSGKRLGSWTLSCGSVILGSEKETVEIDAGWKEKLSTLEEKLTKVEEEKQYIEKKHDNLLYIRKRALLRRGPCFYIIEDPEKPREMKIGHSENFTKRFWDYSVSMNSRMLYAAYTDSHIMVEKFLKTKYRKKMRIHTTEWIMDTDPAVVVAQAEAFLKELDCTYASFTRLEDIIISDEEELASVDPTLIIKCYKCGIEKDCSMYSKDKSRKNGYCNCCKACQKEQKAAIAAARKVDITEKLCTICNLVLTVDKFGKHKSTKDGYTSACRACCQKIESERRKGNKEAGVRYTCAQCHASYARKDTLAAHVRMCKMKVEKRDPSVEPK